MRHVSTIERGGGQIATKLLFENENCRVWLLDLPPGAATDWHVHELDYVFVVTEAAPVHCEFLSGRVDEKQRDHVGASHYKKADSGHRLVNSSSLHYQNIVVELKATGVAAESRESSGRSVGERTQSR